VLAYHLLMSIEKTLLDAIVLPTDGGMVLRIRQGTTPDPAHRELYQKLRIGSEIVSPRKTWSRAEEGSQ
jgi:hypothetical protein